VGPQRQVAGAFSSRWEAAPKVRFAQDSLLEGDGFERSVPGRGDRQTVMGDGTAVSKTGTDLLGNRRFQSTSLQQRVRREPNPRSGTRQAMRTSCLSLTRSADGVFERHRIRSVAYRGKSSRGEPAEWVTIGPASISELSVPSFEIGLARTNSMDYRRAVPFVHFKL
jgi:hypothetical protein